MTLLRGTEATAHTRQRRILVEMMSSGSPSPSRTVAPTLFAFPSIIFFTERLVDVSVRQLKVLVKVRAIRPWKWLESASAREMVADPEPQPR
jgi:hypothetical protein